MGKKGWGAPKFEADRRYNRVPEGEVGPVEQKLLQLGEVRGVVTGN